MVAVLIGPISNGGCSPPYLLMSMVVVNSVSVNGSMSEGGRERGRQDRPEDLVKLNVFVSEKFPSVHTNTHKHTY